MSNTIQNNKRELNSVDISEERQQPSELKLDLQKLSTKHRKEYFEVKPILTSLEIDLSQKDISDKPDFRLCYKGKRIGLETTRCYPPDVKSHQNKYEIGYKGVVSILERYKRYKIERQEWVTLFISFRNGLYYTLRDTSLKRKDIDKIENDVIEEIETRLREGHYSTPETCDNRITELYYMDYKYTRIISMDEPQEGKVILDSGGEATPVRTIEIESLKKTIFDKESKLADYKQMEQNKDIDEYWLCVNLPVPSQRFFYDLEPFEIQSGYSRIYVTQFTSALRIK